MSSTRTSANAGAASRRAGGDGLVSGGAVGGQQRATDPGEASADPRESAAPTRSARTDHLLNTVCGLSATPDCRSPPSTINR